MVFLKITAFTVDFNGLNTFGTMKITSRQGELELVSVSVDHITRSGGIIGISFRFSLI